MGQALIGCVFIPHLQLQLAHQEQADDHRPLAVAAQLGDRAILTEVCPNAAAAGIRPGMFAWDARRRCPALAVVAVDPAALAAQRDLVLAVLQQHADQVDPCGTGAWQLPMLALGLQFSRAQHEAEQLQHAIWTQTGFNGSVGLSARSSVAHIAATVAAHTRRPAIVVLPGTERAFLAPLPVEQLPGVGQRTRTALARLGIASVGQLADLPTAVLERAVGSRGHALQLQANGLDRGTVAAEPSIAATWQTPSVPCAEPHRLRAQLAVALEQIGRSLRAQHTAAGAVTIAVTWTDATTTHRTVRLRPRCDLDHELVAAAWSAMEPLLEARRIGVLQLAASAGQLGPREQLLFAVDDRRVRQLQHAVDTIKARWGPQAIQHGATLGLVGPTAAGVP